MFPTSLLQYQKRYRLKLKTVDQEFHGVHKGLLIQSLQRSLQDARGIGARRSGCDRHGSVPEPLR